jgi:hypothetical protein
VAPSGAVPAFFFASSAESVGELCPSGKPAWNGWADLLA